MIISMKFVHPFSYISSINVDRTQTRPSQRKRTGKCVLFDDVEERHEEEVFILPIVPALTLSVVIRSKKLRKRRSRHTNTNGTGSVGNCDESSREDRVSERYGGLRVRGLMCLSRK
jgi:hypothetical protein